MPARFRDCTDAGRLLADELAPYAGDPDVRVLALPERITDLGGMPP